MSHETERTLLDTPLVLASRSPRRIALLTELGLPFDVCPSEVDERLADQGSFEQRAMTAAQMKARDVAARFPERPVLGADTIVCLDDRVLGKPADAAEARGMLRALRGRWHVVVTGLCLIARGRQPWVAAQSTRVKMAAFTDEEIEQYVATGDPLDKAGAYAIQGEAARFVEAIDGDYFNVVGLPLALLRRGLSQYFDTRAIDIPAPPDRFSQ